MRSKLQHIQTLALFILLTVGAPMCAQASLCELDGITPERLLEIARQEEDLAISQLQQICDEIEALKARAEKAERDQLTGLRNRQGAERFWEQNKDRRARENGQQTYLAFVDIDHFKSVNDIYGHKVGDEVLSRVAAIIEQNLRRNDVVFRWGGEEFAVILEAKDDASVEVFLNRLKNTVRSEVFTAKPLPQEGDISEPVEEDFSRSISIGVSKSKNIQDALNVVLERADEALYKAKRYRNSVVVDCSEVISPAISDE